MYTLKFYVGDRPWPAVRTVGAGRRDVLEVSRTATVLVFLVPRCLAAAGLQQAGGKRR